MAFYTLPCHISLLRTYLFYHNIFFYILLNSIRAGNTFSKAKEYQDVVEQYYPIETIVYGVKNNRDDFIEKGRKEIYLRTRKDEKTRK